MQLSMTRAVPRPDAGIIDDIEREDNKRGFEPEDLTAFHQLVRHLTADGDRRAARAGRTARRKLAEMTFVGQGR
ncbi:hypothetical protein AB0469_35160 [Streptomyces sp. NPDC093801]|uniref:hypothetical protein n=1 Tax=Streptomyces sp. NPDC093801 TaxID=3155203 RepID=UPI00344D0067